MVFYLAPSDRYRRETVVEAGERALAPTRALGLFPERLDASPYDAAFDDEPGGQRPADDTFWARLRWCIATHQAVILEEGYVYNASRWHRLTSDTVDAVSARLSPRARLAVWPDLSTDVDEILAALPDEGLIELVWENEHRLITSTIADETQFAELAAQVTGARAATVLPWPSMNATPCSPPSCPTATASCGLGGGPNRPRVTATGRS
ncbi:MAG: hypothetical protein ACRDOO_18985 [Actinomadura sp.]